MEMYPIFAILDHFCYITGSSVISEKKMYNYKKNMDKPVRIRLVHEYKEYYRLEFCTTNRRFFNTWYPVVEYERSCIHYDLSGGWTSRWFLVESKQIGDRKLAELRSRLKTVGDIYDIVAKKV